MLKLGTSFIGNGESVEVLDQEMVRSELCQWRLHPIGSTCIDGRIPKTREHLPSGDREEKEELLKKREERPERWEENQEREQGLGGAVEREVEGGWLAWPNLKELSPTRLLP